MTGMMKISKDLYDSDIWKQIQDELFDSFDIYSFDGMTIEAVCTGELIPEGIFYCEATHLTEDSLIVEFYRHKDGEKTGSKIIGL